jgi:hypothetical protein
VNLEKLPSVRAEVESLGPGGSRLGAKKSLGQNFLFDLNLTRKIARSGLPLGEGTVVEVGPGPGGLTRALLMEGARKVIAVERDERFRPILDRLTDASDGRLQVIFGDATKSMSQATSILRMARRRSSPICPTMSERRCWSAGCSATLATLVCRPDADVPA